MKFPARPIRTEPSLEPYTYYDHETVVQSDGRIAAFTGNNKDRALGWQFAGWKDSQGFWILEGSDQVGVLAQMLLEHTAEKNAARHQAWLEAEAKRPKPSPEQVAESFSKFSVPLIQSTVAGAAIMPDLVAVQPMTVAPDGAALHWEVSTVPFEKCCPAPAVAADEVLYRYAYGGILSERGGWFVTHRDRPDRVLRYRQDWMS